MEAEQEKYWRDKMTKDIKNLKSHPHSSWIKLLSYLQQETEEGKTEFRLVVSDDKIMIHPQDKDGETIDLQMFPTL